MSQEIIIFFAATLDRIVILVLFLYFLFFFIYKKEKKSTLYSFIFCFVSIVLALVFSMIIKESFMIDRPFIQNGSTPLFLPFDPYSFPSSHSAVFFAISTCLFLLKRKIWVIFLFLSFLITYARVLSGVHTFYDCFVGGLLGIFISYLIFKLMKKFSKSFPH